AGCIGDRHRYRVEMRERPRVVLVSERHIEAGASRSDLNVAGYHGLATADRGPHWLAQHRVDAGAAVLHLAVDADECALAVRDCWLIEQLDELWHQPLTEHRSGFEQLPQIVDEASGERVTDHGHADRTHNGSGRCNAEFREDHLAYRDHLADVDHPNLLRISTTALPLSHTSPTEQVDQVDVVDLLLINA